VLWFDEELGSKTTACGISATGACCGLMKNWDLRQRTLFRIGSTYRCGLMKNWDLRQQSATKMAVQAVVV